MRKIKNIDVTKCHNWKLNNEGEIVLITKQGYLMLVKSLTDDLIMEIRPVLFRVTIAGSFEGRCAILSGLTNRSVFTRKIQNINNTLTLQQICCIICVRQKGGTKDNESYIYRSANVY